MKRFLLLFVLITTVATIGAQNLQLHYDFGEGRKYITTTVEMFKPDKLGNTFFFIDMDYNVGEVEGISLAYWEIARAFNIGKSPFAFHAEYNGGFGQWKDGDYSGSFTINGAWLTGLEYSVNAEDFSKGFTLQALYKYIRGKHDAAFQLTAVWYLNFANNKLSFTGYADFWREDMDFGTIENPDFTKYIFQAEPQLWFNTTEKFAIGSEIEVSYNFEASGFRFLPTLGAKYTF
ncbi:MAG: DUF5020 family protein [Bacteroidota bacterium]